MTPPADRPADRQQRARAFGGVADAYHRGRPTYPDDAVAWLVDAPAGEVATVLELGAGTGKLTEGLVHAGHDVHATEPDAAMLDRLGHHLPDVRVSLTTAEEIPVADRTVDVVVAAQAYHWFDPRTALPEIVRVLKPGGHVAMVWNERDERIPWVRKLGRIIGTPTMRDPSDDLVASGLFDDVEHQSFAHWQHVDRRSIQDLAVSRSEVALMDDAARDRLLGELLALYDDYGRGMDGMQLPYVTRCFRARVADRPEPVVEDDATAGSDDVAPARTPHLEPTVPIALAPTSVTDSAATLPRVAAEPIDDGSLLLIDFR